MAKKDKTEAAIYGYKIHQPHQSYVSGGAGYVFTRKAVELFVEKAMVRMIKKQNYEKNPSKMNLA